MANNSILVLTEFGFGKTTAISKNEELGIMEGLDPKETVLLNVKGKPLAFRGWRKNYKPGLKTGGNYAETTDAAAIVDILTYVNDFRKEIHNFVLDDAQYIMAEQFMADALKTGYEKFSKLGRNMYNVINKGIKLRDDLNFIVLAHQEETKTGYKMLTIGKMLDEKVKLEGLFTCIFFGDTTLSDEKTVLKRFVTNNDGKYPARCFGKGTQIRMFDGSLKNIENIIVGDSILNTESKESIVKHVHTGTDILYNIKQRKGIDYIVNSEHLLYAMTSNTKLIYKHNIFPCKNYQDFYKIKGIKGENKLFNKEVEFPYFLGLWLGDGAKSGTSITTMDDEIINYLKELATNNNLDCLIYDKQKSKAVEVNLGNKVSRTTVVSQYQNDKLVSTFDSVKEASEKTGIQESSISYSISGKYAHAGGYIWKKEGNKYYNILRKILKQYNLLNNKHIPQDYIESSYENRLLLLAGLIDTDGSLSDNTYEFSNTSVELITGIVEIANSLGFFTSVSQMSNNKREEHWRNAFKVRIQGDITKIPCKIIRKQVKKNTTKSANYLTIENIGNGDYYGFELEGKCKTFFLKDYTIVHNSPHGMFDELYIPNDLGYIVRKINEYNNSDEKE